MYQVPRAISHMRNGSYLSLFAVFPLPHTDLSNYSGGGYLSSKEGHSLLNLILSNLCFSFPCLGQTQRHLPVIDLFLSCCIW